MTPEQFREHKRCAFDDYCKKGLKHEASNGYRVLNRVQSREVSLGSFSEAAISHFAAYDRYPWEYTAFLVEGDVILIEEDALAAVLNALPAEKRNIFLMCWLLKMTDREIAEKLKLPRRTVNNRRLRAMQLLKERMGGGAK